MKNIDNISTYNWLSYIVCREFVENRNKESMSKQYVLLDRIFLFDFSTSSIEMQLNEISFNVCSLIANNRILGTFLYVYDSQ